MKTGKKAKAMRNYPHLLFHHT